MIHHDFDRLENGNTLVLLWEPIPAELTRRVVGGYRADDDPQQMLGDVVEEITPDGGSVHRWESWHHLNVDEDVICPWRAAGNSPTATPSASHPTASCSSAIARPAPSGWSTGPRAISDGSGDPALYPTSTIPHSWTMAGCCCSTMAATDGESTVPGSWKWTPKPTRSPGTTPPTLSYPFTATTSAAPNACPTAIPSYARERPAGYSRSRQAKNLFGSTSTRFFLGGQGPTDANPTSINNAVFRAHRYGPDYPGLQDKDLDPGRYANLNRLYT